MAKKTAIQENEMTAKILGQDEPKNESYSIANWLADNVCWEVTKPGCGKSLFNGPMALALMTAADKTKAMGGDKYIKSSTGFIFVRK